MKEKTGFYIVSEFHISYTTLDEAKKAAEQIASKSESGEAYIFEGIGVVRRVKTQIIKKDANDI